MENQVLLAGILPESLVNGTGLRRVLFAQICKHNCPGCFNPDTHSELGGEWFNIDTLIQNIQTSPLISGVTFSGGDPFEQANQFAHIAQAVRTPNFDIWCYTGYTYEYILEHQTTQLGWQDLLHNIDILVDGPFIQSQHDPNLKYRGSSNQRIINVPQSLKLGKIILALD